MLFYGQLCVSGNVLSLLYLLILMTLLVVLTVFTMCQTRIQSVIVTKAQWDIIIFTIFSIVEEIKSMRDYTNG